MISRYYYWNGSPLPSHPLLWFIVSLKRLSCLSAVNPQVHSDGECDFRIYRSFLTERQLSLLTPPRCIAFFFSSFATRQYSRGADVAISHQTGLTTCAWICYRGTVGCEVLIIAAARSGKQGRARGICPHQRPPRCCPKEDNSHESSCAKRGSKQHFRVSFFLSMATLRVGAVTPLEAAHHTQTRREHNLHEPRAGFDLTT